MTGYSTGSRAAADLAQPAPWSPSDRWSGPSWIARRGLCGTCSPLGELQTIFSANLQQEWFQQDGATPHTAAASRLWLQSASLAGSSAWPSEMVDRAVDHLQTVRLPQVNCRGGAHTVHLL